MIVTPDENGTSDLTCNGDHWMLVHDGDKVMFKGRCGHATTPETIEYFNTELEMEERIVQLDLDISALED